MYRSIVLGAAGVLLVSVGVTRQSSLEGRLASMEEQAARGPAPGEIRTLESQVEDLRADLARAERDLVDADAMRARIEELECDLIAQREASRYVLQSQHQRFAAVTRLEAEVERLEREGLGDESRFDGLVRTLEATTDLALETHSQLGRVQNEIVGVRQAAATQAPSVDERWRETVGPTVQLAGNASVGSGVMLRSQPIAGTSPTEYRTLILTAWHVVRDIRADSLRRNAPIPVVLRNVEGVKRSLSATLVAHDVALDAALLELDTNEAFEFAAQLPTRERLRSIRVFHPVVAVGCPLGNDPIPTLGHLSDRHHHVDGANFWMISAPTYIGNSGGGIYSAGTHELLGVFSKIYTHGAIRPTVIPHMGLVTPLEEFYDWLDASQAAEVVESGGYATIEIR